MLEKPGMCLTEREWCLPIVIESNILNLVILMVFKSYDLDERF